MKTYYVEISFLDPYPKSSTYRAEGSNFSAAIGKSFKDWRKDFKGRKIKEISIKIKQL